MIGNFIPQVWSARLLREFRRARRWRRVVTDVSDEIARQGDTIHVGQIISEPTIKDYNLDRSLETAGIRGDIEAPEYQDDGELSFKVNQGKYFNIAVNDVDRVQSKPALLPRFTSKAGYKLGHVWDRFIQRIYIDNNAANGTKADRLGAVVAANGTALLALAPGDLTGKAKPGFTDETEANAVNPALTKSRYIIEGIKQHRSDYTDDAAYLSACKKLVEEDLFGLQRILAEKDWPGFVTGSGGEGGDGGESGLYAICNLKTIEAITYYFLKEYGSQGSGRISDQEIRGGGFIASVLGFSLVPDVGMTNLDPTAGTNGNVGAVQIAMGMRAGIYSAEQIRQTEAYRPEKRFDDAVKGLSVYGASRVDASMLMAVVQGIDGTGTNKKVVGRYDVRGVDNTND